MTTAHLGPQCPKLLEGMHGVLSTRTRAWQPATSQENDEMFPTLEEMKEEFLACHGEAYGYKGWVEQNWWQEVGVRLGWGQHYLDMTGAGLYTNSQITSTMQELTSSTFGNPHSRNPSSSRSTQEVAKARQLVLKHFNADPEQYHVVFTKGATEGLKMVGEYFPWAFPDASSSPLHSDNRSHFIYTQANHKSVLGIGAYAKHCGSQLHCLTLEQMQQWLGTPGQLVPTSSCKTRVSCCGSSCSTPDAAACSDTHSSFCLASHPSTAATLSSAHSSSCCGGGVRHHLVAYPAKDNYEGRMYPLQWIEQVHAKSNDSNKFLVVLDAAAHAACHCLDLSVVQPDFVTLSFYKIFGYPSGLGALLIHKDAARHLRKVYFGGGSVDYCTAEDAWAVMSAAPAGLEDGTLGFLNIAALKHGFELLDRLGGMQAVSDHVESLRHWTYKQLSALQHSNGSPLLRIFGCHEEGPEHQGGIFQFQVVTADGDRLPGRLVEAAATAAGLHLRTGCNCNPGRCLPNLGITPEEERARAAEGHTGPVLVVLRPRPSNHNDRLTRSSKAAIKSGLLSENKAANTPAAAAVSGGGAASTAGPHHLVPVPLPLGSVRASLGSLSTFEDCYALVRFLATTFRDFQVSDEDLLMGVKMVTVLDHAEHELTLKTTISTSEGGAMEQQNVAPGNATPATAAAAAAAGAPAAAAAVTSTGLLDCCSLNVQQGAQATLTPSASSDSLASEGIKAFWESL